MLVNRSREYATHSICTEYHGGKLNEYLEYTMTPVDCQVDHLSFPDRSDTNSPNHEVWKDWLACGEIRTKNLKWGACDGRRLLRLRSYAPRRQTGLYSTSYSSKLQLCIWDKSKPTFCEAHSNIHGVSHGNLLTPTPHRFDRKREAYTYLGARFVSCSMSSSRT